MRVLGFLADGRGRLEADEEEDAEEHAAEDATSLDTEPRRLPRVEHRERDAVLPTLRDDHDPEDQHAYEEEPGREDPEPWVGAVREVLIHRPRAGEAAGVERDDVADSEHAE